MAKKKNKKTFADVADQISKKIGKYEKDIENGDPLTKKTAEMMKSKYQAKLDNLFAEQERMKQESFQKDYSKFMKKYGGMVYANGGLTPPPEGTMPYPTTRSIAYSGAYNQPLNPGIDSTQDAIVYQQQRENMNLTPEEYARRAYSDLANPMDYMSNYRAQVPTEGAIPDIIPQAYSFKYGGKMPKYFNGGEIPPGLSYDQWLKAHLAANPNDAQFFSDTDFRDFYNDYNRPSGTVFPDGSTPTAQGPDQLEVETVTNRWTPLGMETSEPVTTYEDLPADPTMPMDTPMAGYNNAQPNTPGISNFQGPNNDMSWQNMLYKGAAYSPTIYNAIRGMQKPEVLDAEKFQNPYEQQARDLMASRRYNVNPEIAANVRGFNAMRKDIRGASQGNAAQYLANLGSSQSRLANAQARAYANKQNMDNQYMAQQAQMDAQLGNVRAGRELQIADINAQNKAARDAHLGKAFEGLSGIAQNERFMNNQANSDAMRIEALKAMGAYFDPQFSRQGRRYGFQGYNFQG